MHVYGCPEYGCYLSNTHQELLHLRISTDVPCIAAQDQENSFFFILTSTTLQDLGISQNLMTTSACGAEARANSRN